MHLPAQPRTSFERAAGVAPVDVRVYHDSRLARIGLAGSTTGSNVHVGAGRVGAASVAGRWLIAHELAHVVQQHGGYRWSDRRHRGA